MPLTLPPFPLGIGCANPPIGNRFLMGGKGLSFGPRCGFALRSAQSAPCRAPYAVLVRPAPIWCTGERETGFPASFRARLPSPCIPARAQSGATAGAAARIGNCALLGRAPWLLRLRLRSRVPAAALRSVRASLRRVRLLAACGRVLACGYVGGKFPDGIRTGLKSAPAASDAMQ